jgi:putative nucleotidyltransferase with HDIG domain
MDQVLAGRLLAAANSALFGSRHEITRLIDAVNRLGVPIAHKVLLQQCVGGLFASRRLRDLWRHSLLVAAAASELSDRCGIDPDLAYVAGLLHDIGRLELLKDTLGNQIAVQQWMDRGYPLAEAEILTFATDHATTGAEMLRDWNLPEKISHAIALHHTPELAAESPLACLLFVAEVWSAGREDSPPETLNVGLRERIAQRELGLSGGETGIIDSGSPLFEMARVA